MRVMAERNPALDGRVAVEALRDVRGGGGAGRRAGAR